VVKHVDAVELRVVVAEVLAVAADAVLVAKHLLKLGAHLATALARLHVHNLTRRNSLEAGSKREKKGGDTLKTPCGSLARETGNAGGARACIPNWKAKQFGLPTSRASVPYKGRWCGRVRSQNICLGRVPVAVRQGQRHDAVATGEERQGRYSVGMSTYIRLYRHSGK
jgi:hypothetical protein